MTGYKTLIRKIRDLTASDRADLAKLYLSYFDGSSVEQVNSDLENKSEILLVYCDCVLIGFTTMEIYDFQYSGDTVVDKAHWGQQALAFAWIAKLGALKRQRPATPLYWFVIIKGHRTYKYLPAFGKSFYPHWSIDRSDMKPLADALASQKFGTDYCSETGLVQYAQSKGHLKREIAYPSEEEKTKDAVRFFLEKNPGYLLGHELVCLCEITEENMKPLTKRIFAKGAL